MTLPLLPGRDPRAEVRTRQVIDRLGLLLNQLILDGTLFQTGVQSYGLLGLLYTDKGPPAATLGYTGDYYLNLDTGTLYKKE